MTDWKVPLYKIFTDDEDLRHVNDVIKRGQKKKRLRNNFQIKQ